MAGRSGPSRKTRHAAIALSGNQCAFPGCNTPFYDPAAGVILGEIAHICAQSPGGPRFDPRLTENEVHSASNLMVLCAVHHKLVDDQPDVYTADVLRRMKADHEAGSGETSENVIRAALDRIEAGQGEVLGAVRSVEAALKEQTSRDVQLSRPTLDVRHAGTTRIPSSFDTTWDVVQLPGTAMLAEIKYRFRGQRVRPEDKGASWERQRLQSGGGRHVAQARGVFDLTRPSLALDDWGLGPDDLGLEVQFEHAGATWEARCSWRLTQRDTGTKTLVDQSDRGPITYRQMEEGQTNES